MVSEKIFKDAFLDVNDHHNHKIEFLILLILLKDFHNNYY